MPGVYTIIFKDKFVYKHLNSESEVANKLKKRLKKKKNQVFFNYLVHNLCKDNILGDHIVGGISLDNRGSYKSPKLEGPLLSFIFKKWETTTQFSIRIALIYALDKLLHNLRKYINHKGYLIGDWASHNIIWESNSHELVNIDLEGFYTYSPWGPNLSWKTKENKIFFIQKEYNRLIYALLKSLSKFTVSISNKHQKIWYIHFFSGKELILPPGFILPSNLVKFAKLVNYTDWKGKYIYINCKDKKLPYMSVSNKLLESKKDDIFYLYKI